MARAGDKPVQWQMMLDALNSGDEAGARLICKMAKFDTGVNVPMIKKPQKKVRLFTYYYITPTGERGVSKTLASLGRLMGITDSTINYHFKNDSDTAVWTIGKRKGWKVKRVPRKSVAVRSF